MGWRGRSLFFVSRNSTVPLWHWKFAKIYSCLGVVAHTCGLSLGRLRQKNHCMVWASLSSKHKGRAGEMAQRVRAQTALLKVLSSNFSNHMVAHNHPWWDLMPSSGVSEDSYSVLCIITNKSLGRSKQGLSERSWPEQAEVLKIQFPTTTWRLTTICTATVYSRT